MVQEKSEATAETEEQRQAHQQEMAKVPYFAEGVPAKHQHGVLYQGEFETPSDGTAIAVRLHAQALASTGIPVLLRSFSGVVVSPEGIAEHVYASGMPPEVEKEVGHLLTTEIAETRPVIKHVVLRSAEHCRQILMPKGAIPLESSLEAQIAMRDAVYKNTIVYSVWERDRIDLGIAQHLARVRQCWVPCEQNRAMLVASGVPEDRVHVVPHPYRDGEQALRLAKRPPDFHKGWRRYYSIGRWEPRKGFDKLARAFMQAHHPGDPASLTIKWSGSGQWPNYITVDALFDALEVHEDAVDHGWTKDCLHEHIKLIGGRVDRSMILKLHAENNIYVSSSHGEAFNLSAYDAKLAGNRLVHVPWGGTADLAADGDVAVPYQMGPVNSSYKWEHGSLWAIYEDRHLADAMLAAEAPAGFATPTWYQERFSMAAVGKKMRDLVDLALAR